MPLQYSKMEIWDLYSSKINVQEKTNQFPLWNKIFCVHLLVHEAACFSYWAGVRTVSVQPMYLYINYMTFGTFSNVILKTLNQRIKETTGPLQIDTRQFIRRRYSNTSSIVKHLLCISPYRETQRRSVQAWGQFTSNDTEWNRYVQIRELLLKSLNPLNADKVYCLDKTDLLVLESASEEISKGVFFSCFEIWFRGFETREKNIII